MGVAASKKTQSCWPMSPKPVLHYFDINGRGELSKVPSSALAAIAPTPLPPASMSHV